MKLKWSNQAVADVARLHDFLAKMNPTSAARAAQTLTVAPRQLLERPQSGRQLEQYLPREVRRIIVGNYEMRYELVESTVFILRIWHTREER
ncbi:type II toxin-antitoxin system RelE/ParE family toxin [Limnohabitans sp. Rim8]|uniref:type II toxin-antitoxin system RelE/ParE family toxin n=1 Tax=Limnohabitans sp. Rim8 TaxID=1100718 RepID=UPI003306923E